MLRALRGICSVRGVDFVKLRSIIRYLLGQSLYINLKTCTWMVIEHNKIEKVKENLLTNGEIRVTIFNFTRPNMSSKAYKSQIFLAKIRRTC